MGERDHRAAGLATIRGLVAREGLLELGYAPAEAEELLAERSVKPPEELLAAALRATRQGRAT